MSDDFDDLAPLGDDLAPPGDDTADGMDALLAQGALLRRNDTGNAGRLALYFGADLMWVPRVGWHVWAGTHWALDPDEIAVKRISQKVAPLIEREIFHLRLSDAQMEAIGRKRDLLVEAGELRRQTGEDGKILPEAARRLAQVESELDAIAALEKRLGQMRADHRRLANASGNTSKMKAMRDESGVLLSRRIDELDADPLAINTLSGMLRFRVEDQDGRRYASYDLQPHERGQLATKIMPVAWDGDAECPRFDEFFARIQPDPAMRSFILRHFAVGMTGQTEQALAFFHGHGANGKSVLLDLMARIFGTYAAVAKIESLTGTGRRGGGEATPDLMPLVGARMARAAEPDQGVPWQEGLIKDLTGGEPMMVRSLHENFVEFRPIFTLTISGNHKPDIRGVDDGIWRRMMLVPFDVQIPEAERIHKAELDAILFAEAPGILAQRLVPALLDYLEGGLRPPQTVAAATAEFREESDPLGAFLRGCCELGDPEAQVMGRDLVAAFQAWQQANGGEPWKARTIQNRLSDFAGRWTDPLGRKFGKGKSSVTTYVGIRFSPRFARAWEAVTKDQQGRAVGDLAKELSDD
jgi:putative DNA primase/helicase